jgi:hypothetical protein
MHALGRQVESNEFDRNHPVALGVISAEYRAERPGTDLMKNTEGSERVRNRRAGSFRVQ